MTLFVSPGSPASSPGFQITLALVSARHNNKGKNSKAQKHRVISINKSNELSTSTDKNACNIFMINKIRHIQLMKNIDKTDYITVIW